MHSTIEATLTAMATDGYTWTDTYMEYPWRESTRSVCLFEHEHGIYEVLHDEETKQEVEERVKVRRGVAFVRCRGGSWQRATCMEYAPPVTEAQKNALDLISKIHHSNQLQED